MKFGSNIDGHMKEQSWKNDACTLINLKIWKPIVKKLNTVRNLGTEDLWKVLSV